MKYDGREGKDVDFHIYFSKGSINLSSITLPAIVFTPSDDSWNDFTYKCMYEYLIVEELHSEKIRGNVFLGFLDSNDKVQADGFISFGLGSHFNEYEMPNFFTLQGEMKDYRRFVNQYGVKKSNQLLLALNDLVASRRIVQRSKFVESATKTKVFGLAFMRSSERFFAFHNADSVLLGLEHERFSNISNRFSISYKLASFSEHHQFDMNFDTESILPKRISVLIGRNGLGKSQALNTIANSLIKGDERFNDRELGRPMISRLLAIATPGETINTFPPDRLSKRIQYKRLVLNRNSRTRAFKGFGDLCVQLARSEEFIGDNDRWMLFKESIRTFPDIKNVVVPLSRDSSVSSNHVLRIKGKYYVPLLRLNNGGEQAKLEIQAAVISNSDPMVHIDGDIFPLSSGQLAFIKFIVQACLFVENGTLVLLDEPETHLHPNFISQFIRILDRLLKLTGSIAVIATHSAYFVREVPRNQVLVFKEGSNGQVDIQNPRLKTFGADVGAISYFVFEDEITNGLVEDILEQFPKTQKERQLLLSELESELSADVVMFLRRKLKMEIVCEDD
ncbi:AAA family ATPase [Pseudoalteromonas sp. SG44-17]|uniref:AAA family ATPase n=1 Tax=Pseudoalteromonas sp. SG44-17 TaxID=2760963 RepID=UPI0015FF810A|nr:AAA family ATPase [Pseudoalteromonas sp. SG44-17]MBB1411500.1 AAA family ATPase [Pseudoalteromonas sp. SG44-17]